MQWALPIHGPSPLASHALTLKQKGGISTRSSGLLDLVTFTASLTVRLLRVFPCNSFCRGQAGLSYSTSVELAHLTRGQSLAAFPSSPNTEDNSSFKEFALLPTWSLNMQSLIPPQSKHLKMLHEGTGGTCLKQRPACAHQAGGGLRAWLKNLGLLSSLPEACDLPRRAAS